MARYTRQVHTPRDRSMTEALFQQDAYLRECQARVLESGTEGVVLDRTIFYPQGGGQPADRGRLTGDGHETPIVEVRWRRDDGSVLHVPAEDARLPEPGSRVTAQIEWDLRHRHMRMHTCLHLLGAVLRFPVTGGQVGAQKSRLDFDMPNPPDKEQINVALSELIAADHPVTSRWIEESELDPALIRTMSVKPPTGVGRIRLLDIPGVDLQPCGGTHVRSTAEIGTAQVTRIEKKGRQNRRVHVVLTDG